MRKEQKARLGALLVVLLLIGGVLWDAFHRFPAVNTVLSTLTRPISFVVGGIGGGFRGTGNYFASKSALEKENAALKAENEELRQSNVELIGMKAENQRLAKLLKFSNLHPQWKMVSTKVISRDLGDFRDVILIDKGRDDGLEVNMPVVNASGLIGIVDGVYPPHGQSAADLQSPQPDRWPEPARGFPGSRHRERWPVRISCWKCAT